MLFIKIRCFLFFRYVKILQSSITWNRSYPTLISFLVFSFLFFPTLKSVHVWPQLDHGFSTWFPKQHRTERTCRQLFILIYHCFTKDIDLSCKPHQSAKQTSCEELLPGGVSKNVFLNRSGSSPSDWIRWVSCLVQILGEKNLDSQEAIWRFCQNFCDCINFNISSCKPKPCRVLLHRCL